MKKIFFGQLSIFAFIGFLTTAFIGCSADHPADVSGYHINSVYRESFLQTKPQVLRFNEGARNSVEAQKAPYVVLVSLDGFRYDYEKLYDARVLHSIAKNGVQAEGLLPIYPSKTFPNHYSIVTGLYADEHGLVSNEFYDPLLKESYSIGGPSVGEGKWYGGEPLWVTAEKNDFLTASFFWVGSEAPIQGSFPNWYLKYDENLTNQDRVDELASWLKLPEDVRPHFITLYFPDVDTAGHAKGPLSKEVGDAVKTVDETLGLLRDQIAKSGLPINLIVVSDHGMETLDPAKVIVLDPQIDLSGFIISGQGTMMKLYLKPGKPLALIETTVAALKKQGGNFRVWKRAEMTKFHYVKSARIGDIVLEPDAPYVITTQAASSTLIGGNHGWDPQRFRNMQGIFYAEGPAFQHGVTIAPFENIHIFPLIAHILGLKKLPVISGRLEATQDVLAP